MRQPIVPGSHWVPSTAIADWAVSCLTALDMAPDDAHLLAESLVQTSLWGVDSHGIARLPHYLERISRGSITARPTVTVETTGASTAQVHGDQGQGIVVAHRAAGVAADLARASGVGAVGVSDSSHCGAMALYTRPAARSGLVAIAFTHSDSMAAPHGGTHEFFGTNPISMAFPRDGHEPVCLDMATTSIPYNRVVNARREGHPLPEGVAYDRHGNLTTDATEARALLPLGGTGFGHKGYGLALMIDPGRFAGGPTLAATVDVVAARLAAEPGSPLMPGDPELDEERVRRVKGIPIEPGLATQLREWSARLDVDSLPVSADGGGRP
jgi:LDH2 family malate/lactate/ureidoglycolate dehydrogenase